ncbi:MAG: L-threonylcarbamoyladenylate synthase [Gemmatimonadota bacterium]
MKHIPFHTPADYARAADLVTEHLLNGGLIAYPTETVYGFGCALADAPLEALAGIKGGREDKSFLVLVANAHQLPGLIWTPAARTLAQAFWPGPLTLALRVDSNVFPARVVSAGGTVAIRVSPHVGLQEVLRRYAQPITSTSANLPGQAPAHSAREVARLLADVHAADNFLLLDGGDLEPSPSSTLVDCSDPVPRVVRAGAITVDQLKRRVDELRS